GPPCSGAIPSRVATEPRRRGPSGQPPGPYDRLPGVEATELQSRLKQRHDVVELVTEALDDGSGGVDALAAGELARAAERCWHDGDTREAVALCVDALRVLGP